MQEDASVQVMVARIDERLKSVEEKLTSFIDEVRASRVSKEEFIGLERRMSENEKKTSNNEKNMVWMARLFVTSVIAIVIGTITQIFQKKLGW